MNGAVLFSLVCTVVQLILLNKRPDFVNLGLTLLIAALAALAWK